MKNFDFVEPVVVQKQNPKKVKRMRELYKKKNFKTNNKLYNIHHIIGLSLGGTNERENLVVMKKKEHEILHRFFLDPQVSDLQIGEYKIIYIPLSYDLQSRKFLKYATFMQEKYRCR